MDDHDGVTMPLPVFPPHSNSKESAIRPPEINPNRVCNQNTPKNDLRVTEHRSSRCGSDGIDGVNLTGFAGILVTEVAASRGRIIINNLACCTENSTGLQQQSFRYVDRSSPAVTHFSVPEDHHICLLCDGSFSSDVVWTLQDRNVLVTRQGSYQTNQDRQRYLLLTDGSLCLLKLYDSDRGEYRCNQKLVAELQVLSGHDFKVSAGRTLLLPCSGSSRPKQRWFRQREGEKREAIFTLFRNGTEKQEIDRSQLSYTNNALQIQNLQPEDAGEYLCNGVLQAKVTVLTVQPDATSIASSTNTTPVSAVTKTDVDEIKNETKNRPENALLLIAVVGLGLIIILMAVVCALLTSMKCKRKRKHKYAAVLRHEDTEMQVWRTSSTQNEAIESPPLEEETIHYASLGRQNWRERPNWSPPDQSPLSVIYSSVIARTAARN
ncbi:uncharacterized protein LOC121656370 [Melanotaenia boesemani]|uniref:uncharacterized protein LOC121656370 n=1 Tax=Melanotaenia boesemani TaxID=1250792 RepID=UPI001C059481|nr:uncharacterized protein LOC121656370 [Melanotaenia boesemani]